jgi:N-acetylglucosaminyldiphosphoundecaprenol N-acetyl-beta-D-mannosaminyltransferase
MMGVRIGTRSLQELVSASMLAVEDRREQFVFACANPHSLVTSRRDPEFRDALDKASAVVADGVGCTLAASITGMSVGPRITGSAYFLAMMAALNARGGKVFFFGSREEVLFKLLARAKSDYPRVTIAAYAPPFRPWSAKENDEMLAAIDRFEPDVLWVGMTAPKQEKWVSANLLRLRASVIASIGAVFDYYAGVTPRAPQWLCDLGFEWLYRLPREPRRLWQRTVVSAPLFFWFVLRERMMR